MSEHEKEPAPEWTPAECAAEMVGGTHVLVALPVVSHRPAHPDEAAEGESMVALGELGWEVWPGEVGVRSLTAEARCAVLCPEHAAVLLHLLDQVALMGWLVPKGEHRQLLASLRTELNSQLRGPLLGLHELGPEHETHPALALPSIDPWPHRMQAGLAAELGQLHGMLALYAHHGMPKALRLTAKYADGTRLKTEAGW